MSNKFSEDVKRVIGLKDDQASQIKIKKVGGIASTRSVAIQKTAAKAAGDQITKDDAKDSTAAKEDNQDSLTKSPESGTYDAKDLIDGTDGPVEKDSGLDYYPDSPLAESALSSIEATDCESGNDLSIRTDGLYVPIPETSYDDGTLKTSAWNDPNAPPDKLGFSQGNYWAFTSNNMTYRATTLFESAELAAIAAGDTVAGFNQISSTPPTFIVLGVLNPGGIAAIRSWSCDAGSTAVCPAAAPKETEWPSDGKISLTFSDGLFKPNQYDTDATTKFTGQDSSFVPFCMAGGRFGAVRAGRNGGTVLYETDTLNGAPKEGTIVRYYGSDGSIAGFSDVSSMDLFLPSGDTP